MSGRLAPTTTPDTKFFWEALREERLLIQRCSDCGGLRHPPRPMCPRCQSLSWTTVESRGRGTVHSFVLPRHPPLPWFQGTYVVALVDLEEGVRLMANLVGVAPDATVLRIGTPLELEYADVDPAVTLPRFRPAPGAPGPGGAR